MAASKAAAKSDIWSVYNTVVEDYKSSSTKKTLMVDALIVYAVATGLTQVRPITFNTHTFTLYQINCIVPHCGVSSLWWVWYLAPFAQALFVFFVGTFPFNSFLSSFLCHVALFALGGKKQTYSPRFYRAYMGLSRYTILIISSICLRQFYGNIIDPSTSMRPSSTATDPRLYLLLQRCQ
jgi:DAD family